MSEVKNAFSWVERAEEDFAIAGSALRRKKPLFYPGKNPTMEDTKDALRIAKKVRAFVRKFLGVK